MSPSTVTTEAKKNIKKIKYFAEIIFAIDSFIVQHDIFI